MTINQVFFKIFKANFRRYIIFFASCCFAITVFFTYMTILTNEDFMDPNKVNTSLSSAIIAPTICVVLFSIFFVLYAQASFIKFRETEYGMFMVLGMTNLDVAKIMIFENSIIGFLALITGLILGRLFSWLFFISAMKIINYNGIGYTAALNSYIYTAVFFGVVYLLVILYSLLTSLRLGIINLIKASRKADKNILGNPIFVFIGTAMILISFWDIMFNYISGKNSVALRSILITFAGIFLLISNVVFVLEKIFKLSKKRYYKNLIFLSNIRYSFGQSKRLLFLITLLISMTIFFSSIGGLFISNAQNFATKYSPYHIAYADNYGKNKLPVDELDRILNSGKTPLTDSISIGYIQYEHATILSDKELKKIGNNIKVESGKFINLFQVDLTDGYEHQMNEILSVKVGNIQLTSQGKLIKVIINPMPVFGTSIIVLNDNDYLQLKSQVSPNNVGTIHLFNFQDWQLTAYIEEKLTTELEKYNLKNTEPYYGNYTVDNKVFSPVSRIDIYTQTKQNGGFMLFLFSFVGLLFFISSSVIIHFKILTEFEKEKVKYQKLYKIGITLKDLSVLISKELLLLFLLPNVAASIIAAVYNYSLPIIAGKGLTSMCFSLKVRAVYLCVQALFYLVYKNYYIKKFYSIFK